MGYYITFYHTTTWYTVFSKPQEIFTHIDHFQSHNKEHNIFKGTEITQSKLSHNTGMKLEMNSEAYLEYS